MNDEDPPVNIQVARINSKRFSMMGGCLRTGEFPLVGSTTVLDALVNCGGFKEFANPKKIYVLRGTTKYMFNYKDVINGKRMEQNIYLQNGDRIIVPE
jgi:polysaccharide export outer membrane protein